MLAGPIDSMCAGPVPRLAAESARHEVTDHHADGDLVGIDLAGDVHGFCRGCSDSIWGSLSIVVAERGVEMGEQMKIGEDQFECKCGRGGDDCTRAGGQSGEDLRESQFGNPDAL